VPFYPGQGPTPGIPTPPTVPRLGATGVLTRILSGNQAQAPSPAATMSIPLPEGAPPPINNPPPATPDAASKDKGPGVFKKFLNIFRGKGAGPKKEEQPAPSNPSPPIGREP
jgi:hypothetical protein